MEYILTSPSSMKNSYKLSKWHIRWWNILRLKQFFLQVAQKIFIFNSITTWKLYNQAGGKSFFPVRNSMSKNAKSWKTNDIYSIAKNPSFIYWRHGINLNVNIGLSGKIPISSPVLLPLGTIVLWANWKRSRPDRENRKFA